tara:strand:+ start:4801 stop:5172 length:372 start_codon:yes stop_codon:yes gene_type:complete
MRVNMVNVVKGFIVAKPELANDDFDLMWAIWAWQAEKLKPSIRVKDLTAIQLLKMLKGGDLSSPFNISRSRRKAQQHYPETRGKKYVSKQKGQEPVKADVKRETDEADRILSERSREGHLKSA